MYSRFLETSKNRALVYLKKMDKKTKTRLARADSDRIFLTFRLMEIEKLKAKRIFDHV